MALFENIFSVFKRLKVILCITVAIVFYITIHQCLRNSPDAIVKNISDSRIQLPRDTTTTPPSIDCTEKDAISLLFNIHKLNSSGYHHKYNITPSIRRAQCPRRLQLFGGAPPLTALLSFPGSGNTWVRHLIQQLTGIHTGAIFFDSALRYNGFPFEGKVSRVVAVKTHGILLNQFKRYIPLTEFSRVILIIRNVYEAIFSETKRELSQSHTDSGVFINVTNLDWRKRQRIMQHMWEVSMYEAFNSPRPLLVVFYEDLKNQLFQELVKIADFLQSPHLKEFSFCCALQEQEGSFHRKPSTQSSETVYSEEDKLHMDRTIYRVVSSIQRSHPRIAARIYQYVKLKSNIMHP